jgi:hypothetical protein
MNAAFIVYFALFALFAFFAANFFLRRQRKKKLISSPFPEKWAAVLRENIGLYRRLPDDMKKRLHEKVKIFIAEKSFEGCGGLEVTEEMKVTIAGHACMLLLSSEREVYPRLRTILVYPGAYVAEEAALFEFQKNDEDDIHLGESWPTGDVVLAWDEVMKNSRDLRRGRNVALHEFAHQLDQEDGFADGAPVLEDSSGYVPWARVLRIEYENLRDKVVSGRPADMDEYGAEDPAEFFAVATEAFFEKPGPLKAKRPRLYEALKGYYRLDPSAWSEEVKN